MNKSVRQLATALRMRYESLGDQNRQGFMSAVYQVTVWMATKDSSTLDVFWTEFEGDLGGKT